MATENNLLCFPKVADVVRDPFEPSWLYRMSITMCRDDGNQKATMLDELYLGFRYPCEPKVVVNALRSLADRVEAYGH